MTPGYWACVQWHNKVSNEVVFSLDKPPEPKKRSRSDSESSVPWLHFWQFVLGFTKRYLVIQMAETGAAQGRRRRREEGVASACAKAVAEALVPW